MNKDKYTFEDVRGKKDYFAKLTYLDKLVDKCYEDSKESAKSVNKWSDNYEKDTRDICRRYISSFMFVEIIKEIYPVLYKKSIEEVKL